jgi:hypothetical protein
MGSVDRVQCPAGRGAKLTRFVGFVALPQAARVGAADLVGRDVAAQVEFESKVSKRFIILQFQALRS